MPTNEELTELLDTHRRTLQTCLKQQAALGSSHAPPGLTYQIDESRQEIRRLKAALREAGVTVEDEYGDEDDDFEHHYRKAIIRSLDRVEMFGLPRLDRLSTRQRLSMAYVSLGVVPRRERHPDRDDDTFREHDHALARMFHHELSRSHRPGDALRRSPRPVDQAMSNDKRLIIRGNAGAGKTTLLQWLAVRSAQQDFQGDLSPWNQTVPFFIRLRSRVGHELPSPSEFVAMSMPNLAGLMPPGYVEQQLLSGRALVLLDGVDELPTHQRRDLLDWLRQLVGTFGPNPTFVSPGATQLKFG